MSLAHTKLQQNRKEINEGRLKVVEEYMDFYSGVIREAIIRNNSEIYVELRKFIQDSTNQLVAQLHANR